MCISGIMYSFSMPAVPHTNTAKQETCLKPIGKLAQAIDRASDEDKMLFLLALMIQYRPVPESKPE